MRRRGLLICHEVAGSCIDGIVKEAMMSDPKPLGRARSSNGGQKGTTDLSPPLNEGDGFVDLGVADSRRGNFPIDLHITAGGFAVVLQELLCLPACR